MRERLRAVAAAARGDETRVGLATVLGSGVGGILVLSAVAAAAPAVVEATGLSAAWPLALVAGASTAAVVCTGVARGDGLDRRATALGAGAAAATVALLSPGAILAVRALVAVEPALLGGVVDADGLFGLSVALSVPAFALGAAVGYALWAVPR